MDSCSTSSSTTIERRKRLWERNKELYERHIFHGRPKSFISRFRDYFVFGGEDEKISAYDRLHFDTDCSPEERRRKWFELTSHPYLSTAAWASSLINGWAYCHGAHSIFTTEDGILGGEELDILCSTIPKAYDHDACLAELNDLPSRRTQIAPIEAMSIFLDGCMLGASPFFTAIECNPYHPVQAFFDYWSQTLPYFDPMQNIDSTGHSVWNKLVLSSELSHRVWDLQLFRLMVAVRYFVDPRNPQGSDSSIKRLRERMVQLFECGTGNEFIDKVWRSTEVLSSSSQWERPFYLNSMVTYSQHFRPNKMRKIYEVFRSMEFVEDMFCPDRISLVDMGPKLLRNDALNLGYVYPERERGEDVDLYSPAKIVAPAFSYSFNIGSKLTFYSDVNWGLEVLLYTPIWPNNRSALEAYPDLYIDFQIYNRETACFFDETGYDSEEPLVRGALSEELFIRQIYHAVSDKFGIQLSDRAFNLDHNDSVLRQSGLYWTVEPWGISPLLRSPPPYLELMELTDDESRKILAEFRLSVMID